MDKNRVVMGLSGGVDSAVTARLLQEQGYEVYGHWLDIGLGSRADAEAVAAKLGIPFSVGDIRGALEELVCKPFEEDYLAGRTPIPCARCNPAVKFPALFRRAEEVGAYYVATGHYARILRDETGEAFLYRGESSKDQSYMLARLPKANLDRILFPLGSFEKTQVRALARQYGIPVAEKPDSMEICFIPDQDYAAWIEARGPTPPPGNFVDGQGRVLGRHRGIHRYTIGQRRGLGIPAGHRLFVSQLRPETNEVVLSDGEDLYVQEAFCREINPLAPLRDGQEISLRLRHSKVTDPAVLHWAGDGVRLEIKTAARAPTPGQLAVFYDGDKVLGSGWIVKGGDAR